MSDNVTELASELAKATEKVKDIGTELQGRMEKGEQKIAGLKEQVDEALLQIGEIQQKMARRATDYNHQKKSLGRQLYDSDEFKDFAANPRAGRSAQLSIKATITSATTDTDGAAGALTTPDRLSGIQTPAYQQLRIRDLLMEGTTDSSSIEYVRETGFTNNAQAQANEGDKKGQSSLKFDTQTAPVRTIAHWVKASKQILDDASQLESYINARLMYGLKLKEDRQLLNGDNTSGNLHGIIPQATAFADPASMTKYTIIDQIRLAMLQAILAEYPASGHVLNPIDWTKIELLKDSTGRHIIGQPQGSTQATLWNLPVVTTQAIESGKFLTGAFNMAAQIFDRQMSSIMVATENEDDFVKNLVTILCEERLALAVYRPEAFIYGDLAEK